MDSTCETLECGSPLANVYEIPGEPAIVIDGVPNVDSSNHFQPHTVTANDAQSKRDPGFGEWLEGRVVEKSFGEQLYSGKVTKFERETAWYRVVYEDGDFEDLEWHELEEILVPLDVAIPLKTLALKRLRKNEKNAQKSSGNHPTSRRLHIPADVKRRRANQ
ncbi:hypothetical protein IFM89_024220 [Coptis chinensis]|uniref:PTM/DIR17-like Tudor domain-containing protein n=1 Tax=Coptis chinensis TaxID=261450 RepID=A0A835H6J0_9MAGN|nr:hypothetical protein IFM89_024220 [Coptis chinensis]